MKQLIIFFILFMGFNQAVSQTKAITETGDEVVLYDNGTWKYISAPVKTEIPINPTEFKKHESATFLVKSKIAKLGIWIDPKKWTFNKSDEGESKEYEFKMKNYELNGMAIIENVEMPLLNLRDIAIENAISVAPDLEIIHEEYRIVNGLKILHIEMNGTTKGIRFKYYGYYFSGEEGTIQLLTYSYGKVIEKFKTDMKEFLNGFVTL